MLSHAIVVFEYVCSRLLHFGVRTHAPGREWRGVADAVQLGFDAALAAAFERVPGSAVYFFHRPAAPAQAPAALCWVALGVRCT